MNSFPQSRVYVVDHDDGFRSTAVSLLSSLAPQVAGYASEEDFLPTFSASHPACVLLELHGFEARGMATLNSLRSAARWLPVIFTASRADMRAAVAAMRNGAWHVLEKPIAENALTATVEEALETAERFNEFIASSSLINSRFSMLSKREREVLGHVVDGKSSREVASLLQTSPYTVEKQRANILQKLRAKTMAELILLYYVADPDQRNLRAPGMFWWPQRRATPAETASLFPVSKPLIDRDGVRGANAQGLLAGVQ